MSTTTSAAAEPMGVRLRLAREAAGLNIEDAAHRARAVLPNGVRFSRETLRRYETGRVPEWLASFVILHTLADIYGCGLVEVAPTPSEVPERSSGWFHKIPA